MMETDTDQKQLELLFDYTKFHIGIYTTTAAVLAGLIASRESSFSFNPPLLLAAIAFICLAGLAGGVLASSIPHYQGYKAFWNAKIGPIRWKPLRAEYWTYVEHCSFWTAVILTVVSVALKK